MFYEEKEIDRLLKCEQCNQRYIQPRSLPCGEFICTICLENLIEEQSAKQSGKLKCWYCSKEHDMPEEGFPISKKLEKLLETKPNEIYRSKAVEKLETQLRNIKSELNALKSTLDNGIEKIRERCSLLKHQIQIRAESLVDNINKLKDEMQQEIDKYEKKCIESFEKSIDTKEEIKAMIIEGESFYEENIKYLSNLKIDDEVILDVTDEAYEILYECNQLKRDLNAALFTKMQSEFEPSEMSLGLSVLGMIRRVNYISDLDSLILKNEQLKADFISLFKDKFEPTSKWSLLYRASRDGRSAEAFILNATTRQKH
jgi:flagellar biosynthesis chaperone FliJ